jgi:type VI secretion system protein VasD
MPLGFDRLSRSDRKECCLACSATRSWFVRPWPLAAALAALSACAPPPPPPPTVVNVTVNATADDNPTVDNQGAPLALRIYQLTSPANFTGAEFFALYNDDAGALKTDLVHRDDILLAPGAAKSETIQPDARVTAIGVFGAYRDFQHATWRGTADVPAHQATTITVTAGHDGIVVKATSAPAKPGS